MDGVLPSLVAARVRTGTNAAPARQLSPRIAWTADSVDPDGNVIAGLHAEGAARARRVTITRHDRRVVRVWPRREHR